MSGITVTFRGQCLSSNVAAKTAYTKFITEPEPGIAPVEFQVSCIMAVDPAELWKLADWTITGLEPVQGSKDGRQYAFFRAASIKGVPVKVKKEL